MNITGLSSTLLGSVGWQWHEAGSVFAHSASFASEACARAVYSESLSLVSEIGEMGVAVGVMVSLAWTFSTSRIHTHSRAFAMDRSVRALCIWLSQTKGHAGESIWLLGGCTWSSKSSSVRIGWQKSTSRISGRRRSRSAIWQSVVKQVHAMRLHSFGQ